MQLNLRHIIRKDILIYPGYVPETGVKYKVFHYGLRFTVGNWSFDKADWRNADVVNTCWAKFPEPPDPSDLSTGNGDVLRRDLLSIECGKTLNRALYLHHERRNCPASNANAASDKTKMQEIKQASFQRSRKINEPVAASNVSSLHGSGKVRKSLRIWLVGFWALSVLGFLVVISMALSSRKGEGLRTKSTRNKKTYAGYPIDSENSYKLNEKHLYGSKITSEA